jgi:hypothetical protein
MSASVLAQLTLGYRYLWDRQRQPAAIELYIQPAPCATTVDARHLVSTLTELWPARAPRLLLSIRNRALLHDMLIHGRADGAWIVVPQEALADPSLRQRAQQARARGLPLVWEGAPGRRPEAELAASFQLGMYALDDELALQALRAVRAGLQQSQAAPDPAGPLPPGQILQTPPSRVLADWALDQQAAWAVAGWPLEEILEQTQRQPPGPSREVIELLLRAIERDASLSRLEELLSAEPVLAYRFLAHINSPALKLRGPIDTLERGLMVLGLQHVQEWLHGQLAQAHRNADLRPVRVQLVTRAHLLEYLLDPGDEQELRRELYLCGLFSQVDRLLGQPLATALERLPLSQRILQALLEHSGPYHPALLLARALEGSGTRTTQQLCESYGFAQENVNRALLRVLIAQQA